MTTTLSKSMTSHDSLSRRAVKTKVGPESDASFSDGATKELVRWFKLLADETRLKILFLLLERKELNVRSLCDLLRLSQPAVSHHLALLRVDGLIECRRDGKHNYYSILPERFTELVSTVVDAVPGNESHMHFGRVALSVAPAGQAVNGNPA